MKEEKNLVIFCDNIKQLRIKQRLSLKEMASRLQISQRSLQMPERGFLPPRLSVAVLFEIEKSFDIPSYRMFEAYAFLE